MKKAGRILLIFNEVIASLSILIPAVLDVALFGTHSYISYHLEEYVLPIIICLLLPLGLIKPGWPLSRVYATIGGLLVSVFGIQWLNTLIATVFGLSFELDNRNLIISISIVFLCFFNIVISSFAAWDWAGEKRAAFLQGESGKLQKIQNITLKIIQVLIIVVILLLVFGFEFTLFMFGIVLIYGILPRLSERSAVKVVWPADLMNATTACLNTETIQGDMQALGLLERLQLMPQKKDIPSRVELLVMISQVQYRLGDFDKAKECIRETSELNTMIIKQEGVYTDATLHQKATLHDVSCRISGTLKDYGQELDDCMTAIHTMENYANTNAYRIEIANAYIEKADAQRGLGQYGEALEACARASAKLEQVPSDGSALEKSTYALLNRVKAEILLDSGRIDEAEECASKSIKMYDGMREGYDCAIGAAHLIMSKIQSKRGNSEKAAEEFLLAETLIGDRYGKEHPIYKEMIASSSPVPASPKLE